MTDYSASQGQTSVNALAQNAGLDAAGNSAASRKSISADSFRRLTAMLKKSDVALQKPTEQKPIPSIAVAATVAPVVVAHVVASPIVAEPVVAEPVAVEPESWLIVPEAAPAPEIQAPAQTEPMEAQSEPWQIVPEIASTPEAPMPVEAAPIAVESEPWQIMPESALAPDMPTPVAASPIQSESEPWQIVPEIEAAPALSPQFPTFADATLELDTPAFQDAISPELITPEPMMHEVLPLESAALELPAEILSAAPEMPASAFDIVPEASPLAPQIEMIIHGITPEAHAAFMADDSEDFAASLQPEIIAAPVYRSAEELPMLPVLDISPEPAFEPMMVSTPEPAIELVAGPDIEFAVEPTPELAVETMPEPAIEPTPEPSKKIIVPQKPRDAFAVTPNLSPKKPVAAPIQQTPEQEQEAAELARSLLDMMASSNAAGLPQERALAADTLLRMLPRLPLKSLIMLSERVRLMEAPPHLLMAKLIADSNIAVAGPLLEDCMHITDEDLLMVIGEGDFAKIRMIARRRRLTRAITSGLVTTRDDSVFLTLVRNLGAEIPQESFWALAEAAKEFPDLLAPLCTRPDLPVPLAFELFWLAPTPLRRYLLSRFLTDSETLTKILKITRATDGEEQIENNFVSTEKILAALNLAGEGDVDGAAAALASYAEINPVTVARILGDRMGEPLAALLKAAGLPRGQVSDIFEKLKTSASGLIDPSRDVEELQSTFDSLSFNKARILLTYWDWATLKTGPYAPLN